MHLHIAAGCVWGLGAVSGVGGLILASPLTAVAFTLVRELYVKDTLGDELVTRTRTIRRDPALTRRERAGVYSPQKT